MCGVTFVGTTHRRVIKLRYEVEWFVALMSNLTRTFFFCYFFELLKKSELAGMCGVTFVGTTYRRVPKLRYEVEWFVALMLNLTRTFFLLFFRVIEKIRTCRHVWRDVCRDNSPQSA